MDEEIGNYETFYDEIKNMGGVLRLTIPDKIVKIAGYQQGDAVKVMIKRLIPRKTVEDRIEKQEGKWQHATVISGE